MEVRATENVRTRGWRLVVETDGATARLRPGWRLLTATFVAVFPLLVVVTGVGLWLALGRTGDISSAERLSTWLLITVPLALWLLAVSLLARAGAYRRSPLAVPAGVLLAPAIGLLLLTRLPHLPQLLHATPQSWLIGVMVVRLVGSAFLLAWASGAVAKPWFVVWAGSVDVFVGATALPLAWWVSSGSTIALAVAVAWNVLGLFDFAVAIVISRRFPSAAVGNIISANTPVADALRPAVLGIVTWGVPWAIMIHVLSLWQLLAA